MEAVFPVVSEVRAVVVGEVAAENRDVGGGIALIALRFAARKAAVVCDAADQAERGASLSGFAVRPVSAGCHPDLLDRSSRRGCQADGPLQVVYRRGPTPAVPARGRVVVDVQHLRHRLGRAGGAEVGRGERALVDRQSIVGREWLVDRNAGWLANVENIGIREVRNPRPAGYRHDRLPRAPRLGVAIRIGEQARSSSRAGVIVVAAEVVTHLVGERHVGHGRPDPAHRKRPIGKTEVQAAHGKGHARGDVVLHPEAHQVGPVRVPHRVHFVQNAVRRVLQLIEDRPVVAALNVVDLRRVNQTHAGADAAVGECHVDLGNAQQNLVFHLRDAAERRPSSGRVDHHDVDDRSIVAEITGSAARRNDRILGRDLQPVLVVGLRPGQFDLTDHMITIRRRADLKDSPVSQVNAHGHTVVAAHRHNVAPGTVHHVPGQSLAVASRIGQSSKNHHRGRVGKEVEPHKATLVADGNLREAVLQPGRPSSLVPRRPR